MVIILGMLRNGPNGFLMDSRIVDLMFVCISQGLGQEGGLMSRVSMYNF